MRPLPCLFALLFAPAAYGADPNKALITAEPAPKLVEEKPVYWYNASKNPWIGEPVARKDIHLGGYELSDLGQVCLIPPSADWVAEGAAPKIEDKYLDLLWRAAYAIAEAEGRRTNNDRTVGSCGVYGHRSYVNLNEFSNYFNGIVAKEIKDRHDFRGCLGGTLDAKGAVNKYASRGKVRGNASLAVKETLLQLIASKNPEIARDAIGAAALIVQHEPFRDAIEKIIRDKSNAGVVEIKPDSVVEKVPVRVYAMRTLAWTEPTERTAKVLASVWSDRKETEEMREGAIRAFAYVAQWPGPTLVAGEPLKGVGVATNGGARHAMLKNLYPFLIGLMTINGMANDDKEEKGLKQISPLGEAAYCGATMWPVEARTAAKKGAPWPDPAKK